ncbi:ribbon-helix-helix domain-containing protein [Patescibacteria group bacterium]|nr:ribbon-helix-helix domain-containing protein [Patescibacteria group bacterium]MBU4057400.1 ribbon-helix-helix domain-containing protein [Patescibacteria group bacterium]MBU4115849.1 ribbon-helix-helix domain-containing protein [Patescibacteria group bacterium]
MRNIVNISLPNDMVNIVKKEVKKRGYASTSEFFRHLIRMWNQEKLAEELKKDYGDVKKGKIKLRTLKSLKALR